VTSSNSLQELSQFDYNGLSPLDQTRTSQTFVRLRDAQFFEVVWIDSINFEISRYVAS